MLRPDAVEEMVEYLQLRMASGIIDNCNPLCLSLEGIERFLKALAPHMRNELKALVADSTNFDLSED